MQGSEGGATEAGGSEGGVTADDEVFIGPPLPTQEVDTSPPNADQEQQPISADNQPIDADQLLDVGDTDAQASKKPKLEGQQGDAAQDGAPQEVAPLQQGAEVLGAQEGGPQEAEGAEEGKLKGATLKQQGAGAYKVGLQRIAVQQGAAVESGKEEGGGGTAPSKGAGPGEKEGGDVEVGAAQGTEGSAGAGDPAAHLSI